MGFAKHSMVWVLLCVAIFLGEYGALRAKSDETSTFLDDKEDQVVRIANLSTINEASTCDLVANCSSECSRFSCSPLKSDNLTCATVAQNTNCFQDPATETGFCTSIRANFERSYLMSPPYMASGKRTEVPFEIQNSVCSQRLLDPLFKQLHTLQNCSLYYFRFFFGSVDGTLRFYPGEEGKDCYRFDPRVRPWYTGAISVQKDLVVLLDTGYTMGDDLPSATFQFTRLAATQNATQEILQTLSPGDRVTVIAFNNSPQATPLPSSYLVPQLGLNTSDSGFQQLLESVNNTTVSNSNGVSGTNYTAALNQAVSTFNQSSPSGALKIVILFTDGSSSPSTGELVSVIEDFQNEPIRLFVFEVGDDSNPALGKLACQVNGFAELLNPLDLIQNPLFTVNSYFTFLAQSQKNTSDGTRPFWQRVYPDYGNLGNIITVAYAAMSSDGSRLIGVTGIDVQTYDLGLNFRNLLDSDLVNSRRVNITTNPVGVTFADCSPAYNDTLGQCSDSNPYPDSPFCNQTDFSSTYEDLVCCADCGIVSGGSPGSTNTKIFAGVVCGGASLVTLMAIFIGIRFRRRRTNPSGFRTYHGDHHSARTNPGDHHLARTNPGDHHLEDFVKIPRYTYETLAAATNQFNEENKLGSGTFGTVYKGTLQDGSEVAVKKLFIKPNDGFSDFEAEIRVLATANHTNLVALKGFCVDQHHLLVYEFVENGDLEQWLFIKPVEQTTVLPWEGRVAIALGMAKGLAYLHEDLQNHQKVCHSDIKPANILLNSEFSPKVSDFGMSKLYEGSYGMNAMGGTFGYIAPEILSGVPATTKTDVYSYGVVLMETVTGRRVSDPSIQRNLPKWVSRSVERNEPVLDPRLKNLEKDDEKMAERLVRIALLCTSNNVEYRPDMSAVVKMIEGSLAVRSLPIVSPKNEGVTALIDDDESTFTTNTPILGLNKSRTSSAGDPSSKVRRTWPFSDTFKKLVIRSGKPDRNELSPSSSLTRRPSRPSVQPENSSSVF